MASRIVTDSGGRIWTCSSAPMGVEGEEHREPAQGRDIVLSCTTASVPNPVELTVGWQWERMAAPGLARLLNQASPAARR